MNDLFGEEGFERRLGIELVEVTPDRVIATMEAGPAHQQPYGIVHGGVFCALVETVASVGAATWAMSQDLVGVVGLSNTTDFIRSHRSGQIRAEATPIHRGRTQQIWQVELTRASDQKLISRGQVRLQNLTSTDSIGGVHPPGSG